MSVLRERRVRLCANCRESGPAVFLAVFFSHAEENKSHGAAAPGSGCETERLAGPSPILGEGLAYGWARMHSGLPRGIAPRARQEGHPAHPSPAWGRDPSLILTAALPLCRDLHPGGNSTRCHLGRVFLLPGGVCFPVELATSVAARLGDIHGDLGPCCHYACVHETALIGAHPGRPPLLRHVNGVPRSAAISTLMHCRGCGGLCSCQGIRKMLSHPPYAGEPLCDGGLDLGIPQEGRPGGRVRF
jgi:hypothetical protein